MSFSLENCSLGGPPWYRSAAVLFDRGHPCFWNFNPIIPVDVIRVKSYVNSLFNPSGVPMCILGDPGAVSRRRAKGRDESFQERAEEPLGTKSHRTISKRLCEYRLLIGQKKIPCIILPNQEPVFAKPFGNGPVRFGTQGFFGPFLKTFVAPFRPPPTDCPWVSEDGQCGSRLINLTSSQSG